MACASDTWEKKLQDPSATPVLLPLQFLKEITRDFSAERDLGRGGYGVVYKGILPSGKFIAVKKLHNSLHNLGDENFLKEASSLMKVNHQNVVQFLGYCAESSFQAIDPQGSGKLTLAEIPKRLLCFEHVCNKSLSTYISDESSGLEWNMRYDIIRGICGGLRYLHEECHIVHLDMKPDNILMDATMAPKIADFGLSRIFGVNQSRAITKNCPGTLGYMAPEYMLQGIVSIKADIYSLGVIIIEILTGRKVYPLSVVPYFQQLSEDNSPQSTNTSFQHFKEKILEKWRNRLQKSQRDTVLLEQIRVCSELAIQCIASNPGERPVTKHMIDRLDEVNIMDGSIETAVSSSSAVVQVGEALDALQLGDTSSKVNSVQEEGHVGHHVKLTEVYQKIRAAESKLETEVPLHSITDEGETSTARVASWPAKEHHVLESMLCDESVEPTFLNLSLLEDITNNFSDDQKIAINRLGAVYKGKLSNGGAVVVKRLAISTAIGDKLFLHAMKSLMSVKHSNIVRFLGYCAIAQGKVVREGGEMVMVMLRERLLCYEYLCNGNLQMHLTDESCGFDWHARYQTIKGICQGLHYLHDNCIAHLDLKPDNILFDEKMVPKLLDYGFSRVFSEEIRQTVLKNIEGSMAYMATPEYLDGGEITLKSDIYSLGVIIMQIVTGKNKKNYSNIASIVESWRSRLELDASKGGHTFETCYQQVQVCVEIGIRCMDHDPGNRPNTPYIINRLHKTETERSVRSDASYSPAPRATPARIKMALKVPVSCDKGKSFVMQIVSKIAGVESLAFESEKDMLTVVGNVDAVVVIHALRKKAGHAELLTVLESNSIAVHDQESDSAELLTVRESNSIAVHDQESDSCTTM